MNTSRSVAMIALACFVAAPLSAQEIPASSTPLPLNPVALSLPLAPRAVPASDRRRHLTWEVLALSLAPKELRVESISVRAADGSRPLLEYSGEAVGAHMSPLAQWTQSTDRLPSSGAATLWLDLALEPGTPLPAALEMRVVVSGEGVSPMDAQVRLRIPVDPTPPRVIGAPLEGQMWGVLEACCDQSNHHRRGQRSVDGRLLLPERYAIDFIRFDRDANYFKGEDVNANHYAYGQPVLAVADATVVDVFDRLADIAPHAPLPPPSLPNAGGNHVILDLGGGAWAMYGHLKTGSVRVKAGDRVKAGQVLAQIGNNGNSDMPHLHFQLMDSRHFALAQGLPFVFERYQRVGRLDPKSERIVPEVAPIVHKDDLPLVMSVIDFPVLPR